MTKLLAKELFNHGTLKQELNASATEVSIKKGHTKKSFGFLIFPHSKLTNCSFTR